MLFPKVSVILREKFSFERFITGRQALCHPASMEIPRGKDWVKI
jgi:hypothetical protein